MSPEKRLEIARKGGQSVKPENRAFAKDKDLAAEAGRKGGAQSPGKRSRRVPASKVAAQAKLDASPGGPEANIAADPAATTTQTVN